MAAHIMFTTHLFKDTISDAIHNSEHIKWKASK